MDLQREIALSKLWLVVGGTLLSLLGALAPGNAVAQDGPEAEPIVTVVDPGYGRAGYDSSLALDKEGRPAIAYRDAEYRGMKLALCDDADCATPHLVSLPVERVPANMSLVFNNAGYPIVAYVDWPAGGGRPKLALCQDSTCSLHYVRNLEDDPEAKARSLSAKLNSQGRLVVAYGGAGSRLKLAVCTGSLCFSPDLVVVNDTVSPYTVSLALDSQDRPVISYWDSSDTLWLAICHDETCTTHTLRKIAQVKGLSMSQTALALDSQDRPLISYYDGDGGDLKMALCWDAACSRWTLATVDNGRFLFQDNDVGRYASLALSRNGQPVVSYLDYTARNLKQASCAVTWPPKNSQTGTAEQPLQASLQCTSRALDSADRVGQYTSLALDAEGRPRISYHDFTNGDLKLAACASSNCAKASLTTVDRGRAVVGRYASLILDGDGLPLISYAGQDGILKVASCNDATCSEPSLHSDLGDEAGTHYTTGQTSLAVNRQGRLFVSKPAEFSLVMVACDEPICANRARTSVDPNGGDYSSLALPDNAPPRIAFDRYGGSLHLAYCNSDACDRPIKYPVDEGDIAAEGLSLALTSGGQPVISYADAENSEVKLAFCGQNDCLNPRTIRLDSGAAGSPVGYTSLAFADAGRPLVSYHLDGKLLLALCDDADCRQPSYRTVAGGPAAGAFNSLAVASDGRPVISYYDEDLGALRLAVCDDAACQQPDLQTVDDVGNVGHYNSLALDDDDTAFIGYYDVKNWLLKLAVVELGGGGQEIYVPLVVR